MLDDKKHNEIVKGILEIALASKPTAAHLKTGSKANDFGVLRTDVEQILIQMADSRLIHLAAWDGSAERPYTEWPSHTEFFYNRTDAGHVRVTLLIDGERELSRMSSRERTSSNSRTRERKPRMFETAIDTYTVISQKGAGGSGIVFEVRTSDGHTLALKLLDKSRTPRQKLKRFRNEIVFCMQPVSSHIVRVLDYGTADGCLFYVMPFYAKTFRDLVKEPLLKGELFELYGQVLDGVDAAHLRGVLHRDIKPENILYDPVTKQIVLADFGVCQFREDELLATTVETGPRERLANFAYAAPEQRVTGQKVDQTADIYALGLILNELFTGQIPQGTNYRQIAEASPEFAYLDKLVEQMLSQKPSERPQSIRSVKDELIARGNDFIHRLKLDALKKIVVRETELTDPIVSDPIRAVEKIDYHDGVLSLRLNHPVPEKWIQCFRSRATAFSANMSSAHITFSRDRVYIRANDNFLEHGVQYFKQYCVAANEAYAALVQSEHRAEIERERSALAAEIRQEEVRAKALAKVHL